MLTLLASTYDPMASPATTSNDSTGLWVAGVLLIVWLLIIAAAIAFFIWNIILIVDASQRTNWGNNQGDQKTLWLVLLIAGLILGFGWIVSIIYYFMIKKPLGKAVAGPSGQFQPTVAPTPPPAPSEAKPADDATKTPE